MPPSSCAIPLQPLVEDLRQRECRRLEDDARNRRGHEHDHRHAQQQRLVIRRTRVTPPAADFGAALGGNLVAPRDRVGDADRDRDDARHDEGDAPAAIVDQIAGDQRGARDAEIAPHAVHRQPHAGVLPFLRHHREADRMIDRGEHADHEQADADLQRRLREPGRDRRRARCRRRTRPSCPRGSICRRASRPDRRTRRRRKSRASRISSRSP